MTKPTKPTVPPAPLRSQPQTFSANAETFLAFWPTFATYLDDVGAFTNERANAALAAAIGGDLPPLTGQALRYLRVNASETAAEFFNPLFSPALTGTPTAPTQSPGNNSTRLANTAFVGAAVGAAVTAATSGAAYGAVGTYATLRFQTLTTADPGTTHAGSLLLASNSDGQTTGTTRSGTWRLMGMTRNDGNRASASLFLRIA